MTNAKPKNIFKNRLNNYDNMDPVDAEFEEAMKQYEYKIHRVIILNLYLID